MGNNQNFHIELSEWINVKTRAKDPLLFVNYVSANPKNFGSALIPRSAFSTLIEAVEKGFADKEFVVCNEGHELFRIINEDGLIKLRLEYSAFRHSSNRLSVELLGEKLAEFINDIKEQLSKIDWEKYGKVAYIKASLPTTEIVPLSEVLSANQFQFLFCHKAKGKELKMILIEPDSSMDFFEVCCFEKRMSYWPEDTGTVIYVFEDFCLELIIHAMGLFNYRVIEGFGEEKFLKDFDYLPDYVSKESAYLEIESFVDVDTRNKKVKDIIVEKTGTYAFGGTEEIKDAAEKFDLPAKLIIAFEDDTKIKFIGSDIEYFYIEANYE